MRRILVKWVILILAILTIWTGMQSLIHVHYHKLPDGSVIAHSHPYNHTEEGNGTPFESHHHTKIEFLLIQQVNILLPLLVLIPFLAALLYYLRKINITKVFHIPNFFELMLIANRAPPFSS